MQLEWKRDAVTNKDLATDTLNLIKVLIAAIILSPDRFLFSVCLTDLLRKVMQI